MSNLKFYLWTVVLFLFLMGIVLLAADLAGVGLK